MTALRRPRRLAAGDTVAVVAPSGPVEEARLRRGAEVLRAWGLTVRVGRHALDRDGTERHLAGADAARAADLQEAWCDPAVAAVLCARGGSGAARLLDLLDWSAMAAAGDRVLLGGSDVTVLHQAVAARLGLTTLFGPMPASEIFGGTDPDPVSAGHLRATLFEPERTQVLHAAPSGTRADGVGPAGAAEGALVGGTISLLAGTVGTPECRPARDGIVVLEDVNEPVYRLDGMLTQLLRSGWFDAARGVVLGSFTGCGDGAQAAVATRLGRLGLPLLTGLPFGHGVPQLTVPLGLPARLDVAEGTLTVRTPALA